VKGDLGTRKVLMREDEDAIVGLTSSLTTTTATPTTNETRISLTQNLNSVIYRMPLYTY